MKELENENALLREKIESLYSSSVSIYISWFTFLQSYIFCLELRCILPVFRENFFSLFLLISVATLLICYFL